MKSIVIIIVIVFALLIAPQMLESDALSPVPCTIQMMEENVTQGDIIILYGWDYGLEYSSDNTLTALITNESGTVSENIFLGANHFTKSFEIPSDFIPGKYTVDMEHDIGCMNESFELLQSHPLESDLKVYFPNETELNENWQVEKKWNIWNHDETNQNGICKEYVGKNLNYFSFEVCLAKINNTKLVQEYIDEKRDFVENNMITESQANSGPTPTPKQKNEYRLFSVSIPRMDDCLGFYRAGYMNQDFGYWKNKSPPILLCSIDDWFLQMTKKEISSLFMQNEPFTGISHQEIASEIFKKLNIKPDKEILPESITKVPDWIKNNAGWWAQGQIDDSTFVSGIEFLINEKIIDIQDLQEKNVVAGQGIPEWIKNNAGWWADGLIGEDDFVNGIKYLVEKGIIRIGGTDGNSIIFEDFTLTFTRYGGISGEFEKIFIDSVQKFMIKEMGPYNDGKISLDEQKINELRILLNESNLIENQKIEDLPMCSDGYEYTLEITSENKTTSLSEYTCESLSEKFQMIIDKIRAISTPTATQTPTSQTNSSKDCSGDARCISGMVTRVTDGDTIKVYGTSIRFSLSSSPELDEPGGKEAKQFIESICPAGSTALVDEDDGQTEGSYGRILGVVYCNGQNLNEKLVSSGHGIIDTRFCNVSEFNKEEWSITKCFPPTPAPQKDDVPDVAANCDPSYPDFCIPSPPPDLDCKDIPQKRFTVLQPDPHRFDGDKDGIGCES